MATFDYQVAAHLVMSRSWGLFHKAIMESPGLTQVPIPRSLPALTPPPPACRLHATSHPLVMTFPRVLWLRTHVMSPPSLSPSCGGTAPGLAQVKSLADASLNYKYAARPLANPLRQQPHHRHRLLHSHHTATGRYLRAAMLAAKSPNCTRDPWKKYEAFSGARLVRSPLGAAANESDAVAKCEADARCVGYTAVRCRPWRGLLPLAHASLARCAPPPRAPPCAHAR